MTDGKLSDTFTDPTTLDSFEPQREAMDAVLDPERNKGFGVLWEFPTYKIASAFRLRCYDMRKADRLCNKQIYPEGHELYGHSVYDPIVLSLRGDATRIHAYIPIKPTLAGATEADYAESRKAFNIIAANDAYNSTRNAHSKKYKPSDDGKPLP